MVDAGFGLTRVPDVTDGWSRGDDGRLYFDRCHQYEVALGSWWQLPALLAVIVWAREHFRQEAIYFEVASIPEVQ